MCFSKKKKERRENTGDIVIPGMDGEKKAGGCCFRKSSSFRMVAQGRKRGRERERERGKRPRFWVTRPRVIPVTESACVKRCPIARSAQPFRPDGNHLPRDYHAYTHCSIFLEEGWWWWWWWSLGRRLVDCKNCYFFFFSSLFFFFYPRVEILRYFRAASSSSCLSRLLFPRDPIDLMGVGNEGIGGNWSLGAGLNFVAEDICGFILETGNYYSLYFNGRLSIKNCSVFITFVIIYIKMLQVVLLYSNWEIEIIE